jgi:hypothetical protein
MHRSHRWNLLALLPVVAVIGMLAWTPWLSGAGQHAGVPSAPSQNDLPRKRFATDFPLAEQPVSERGAWHHLGRSWAMVRSLPQGAVGTQTGTGRYDDSYAYLDGFLPDQTAEATLWMAAGVSGDYREFELLLRWSDSPTSARGYECNLAWDGRYAQIVRWNGPYGDFTYIANQTRFAPGLMPPRTGDIFKATIRGSSIRIYLNKNDGNGDQLVVQGSDATFKDGNPGIGFYIGGQHDPARFGFSRYAAWSE